MPADAPRGNGPADVPLRIGGVRRTTILSITVGDNSVETSLCGRGNQTTKGLGDFSGVPEMWRQI